MRTTVLGIGGLLVGLVTAATVQACGAGMPSPAARFATTDLVVVGRILTLEEKAQSMLPVPGAAQKADYRIAVLRIDEDLKGAQGLTHVRVALLPHQVLKPGYEGCFFLRPHFEELVYLFGTYDYPIAKSNALAFAQEMDRYRHWGKLLADPEAGFNSKDADERLLTAALLIAGYRTYQRGIHRPDLRTRPVDARESRRILEVLAEADWNKAGPDFRLSPPRLFGLLGATPKDGWVPRGFKSQQEYQAAVKAWLKEHAATFRIQAYVRA